MARFDLTDFEYSVIGPLLPNKLRGVPRVDASGAERHLLALADKAPWADITARHGPHTTCVNDAVISGRPLHCKGQVELR